MTAIYQRQQKYSNNAGFERLKRKHYAIFFTGKYNNSLLELNNNGRKDRQIKGNYKNIVVKTWLLSLYCCWK